MGLFRFIGRLFKAVLILAVILVALIVVAGNLSGEFKEFVDKGKEAVGDEYGDLFKDGGPLGNDKSENGNTSGNNGSSNNNSGNGSSGIEETYNSNATIGLTRVRNHQKVKPRPSNYLYDYVYRDAVNRGTQLKWDNPRRPVDHINTTFGLPRDFFDRSFSSTSEIRRVAERGYFRVENNVASPDYNRMIEISKNLTKPIYDMIMKKVGNDGSFQKPIDELLKFCQDIPYKIPADVYKDKQTGGIFPPSLALTNGYADCDTKAVLFASVLLHNPRYKIVFITIPGHLFLAIKGVPRPYQKYITYRGDKYILCEPTGPARLAFGKDGFNNYTIKKIEPIRGYYN